MFEESFKKTGIIVSGTPAVEAPDPSDRIRPWTLDNAGRPIPLQDEANSGIVMSSRYAFNAALALAEMRQIFSGAIHEQQK